MWVTKIFLGPGLIVQAIFAPGVLKMTWQGVTQNVPKGSLVNMN
jgi:hypothetical protein